MFLGVKDTQTTYSHVSPIILDSFVTGIDGDFNLIQSPLPTDKLKH